MNTNKKPTICIVRSCTDPDHIHREADEVDSEFISRAVGLLDADGYNLMVDAIRHSKHKTISHERLMLKF